MKKCIRKNRSFEIFLGCVVKDIIKRLWSRFNKSKDLKNNINKLCNK